MRCLFQFKFRESQNFLRFLTAIFLLSFGTSQVFAQALNLPSDFGKIQDVREGTNDKTIVLVQEAHVDLEAQKSLIKVLKSLMIQTGVQQFLVEGGWGDVSLSRLRVYGTPEARRKILDRYLESGKISAEEYLDVMGEFPMKLWGIEDEGLYARNMESFLLFHDQQSQALKDAAKLQEAMRTLAEHVFNKALKKWEARRQSFQREKTSLGIYLPELVAQAHADLKNYPEIRQISALTSGNAEMDLEKLEKEKRELRAALSRRVSKVELEPIRDLMENKHPEKERELLSQMFDIVARYPDIQKSHPSKNLRAYEKILSQTETMDLSRLFSDIRRLENEASLKLTKTEEEKTLLRLQKELEEVTLLFELRMGPEDYRELVKDSPGSPEAGSKNQLLELIQILKPVAEQKKVLWNLEALAASVSKKIPLASKFYESAMLREEALIKNTAEAMKKNSDEAAVVITGGFHATRMARELNQKGFTVLTVTPRFEPKDTDASQEKYFRILKDKWSGVKNQNSKFNRI